jgi:hypothetical protein
MKGIQFHSFGCHNRLDKLLFPFRILNKSGTSENYDAFDTCNVRKLSLIRSLTHSAGVLRKEKDVQKCTDSLRSLELDETNKTKNK